jgi:hypothetical protein
MKLRALAASAAATNSSPVAPNARAWMFSAIAPLSSGVSCFRPPSSGFPVLEVRANGSVGLKVAVKTQQRAAVMLER